MSGRIEDYKPESWTCSSNEALKISLVSNDGVMQFPPSFTYPIYGESEQIFGFQNLVIHLVFDSITFKPFVNVKCDTSLNEEIKREDILNKLTKFLPKDDYVVKDEGLWVESFEAERVSFALPSNEFKIGQYKESEDTFSIYKVPLQADERLKQFHRRIQIFSLLFIEAASYIKEDEPNWEILYLFNDRTKQCLGYCTTYKYWNYMGHEEFDSSTKPSYKAKISQFIIFPPYQGKGHGSRFYENIVNHWTEDKQIVEITVEDPNESFDDLRDRSDFRALKSHGLCEEVTQFTDLIPDSWITQTRHKFKLESRQFHRLIELAMLSKKMPNYNIQVKKRLLIKNNEPLADMETDEDRIAALNQALNGITEDYHRLLDSINSSGI